MKITLVRVLGVLFAVSALALTGCQTANKINPFGKNTSPLPPPPPVNVVQAPIPTALGTAPFKAPRHPERFNVSVFDNVVDARPRVGVSGASVVVNNKRTESIAIQVGDRLLGISDEAGQIAVVIVPPGESFAFHDLGFGQKILAKALVLNDQGDRVGYIPVQIVWPRVGSGATEAQWDVLPMVPATNGVPAHDPMVALPISAGQTAVPVVTPVPATP